MGNYAIVGAFALLFFVFHVIHLIACGSKRLSVTRENNKDMVEIKLTEVNFLETLK